MQSDKNPRTWTVECILEWLRIREQEGKPFPSSLEQFEMEIDHSALLQRLLCGRKALPDPPPLFFSTPWYQVVESGEAAPYEVWEADDPLAKAIRGGRPTVMINGYPWDIVEKLGENDFCVTYGSGATKWHLWLSGIAVDERGVSQKMWKLVRI